MSNYKHFKHYYNPYDSLDVEWQYVVSKGYLTISEIVCLSGFTKSYIYRLVKNGVIPSLIENNGRQVKWTDFVHWYSHLPETPSSPIGESSFSIYGLMNYTGMYGAQNEAYNVERERKTPKAVYLQIVAMVETMRSAQNEMFTLAYVCFTFGANSFTSVGR